MFEYLSMNGHGIYVWSGYLISFVVLGVVAYSRARGLASIRTRSRRDQSGDSGG